MLRVKSNTEIRESLQFWAEARKLECTPATCTFPGTCGTRVSYLDYVRLRNEHALNHPHGRWLQQSHCNGAVFCCSEQLKPARPWAADLDPVKVRNWLTVQDALNGGGCTYLLDWDDLRRSCSRGDKSS